MFLEAELDPNYILNVFLLLQERWRSRAARYSCHSFCRLCCHILFFIPSLLVFVVPKHSTPDFWCILFFQLAN